MIIFNTNAVYKTISNSGDINTSLLDKKALAKNFSAYYIRQVTEIRERSSVG